MEQFMSIGKGTTRRTKSIVINASDDLIAKPDEFKIEPVKMSSSGCASPVPKED
jgi:hypothetical protein